MCVGKNKITIGRCPEKGEDYENILSNGVEQDLWEQLHSLYVPANTTTKSALSMWTSWTYAGNLENLKDIEDRDNYTF